MIVFFFKQKTAYEMRISDWSSDVCSSDLLIAHSLADGLITQQAGIPGDDGVGAVQQLVLDGLDFRDVVYRMHLAQALKNRAALFCKIGRAPCRERVCQYV